MERLYEYLDGELTPEREAEVRAHLDRCRACLALSRFENAFLRFLEARARAQRAPESLRRRILEQFLFNGDDGPEQA